MRCDVHLLAGCASLWLDSLPGSSFLRTGGETREDVVEVLGLGEISMAYFKSLESIMGHVTSTALPGSWE